MDFQSLITKVTKFEGISCGWVQGGRCLESNVIKIAMPFTFAHFNKIYWRVSQKTTMLSSLLSLSSSNSKFGVIFHLFFVTLDIA